MNHTLQVSFTHDDFNSDVGELIETIRHEVAEIIANYSDTFSPKVKIWECAPEYNTIPAQKVKVKTLHVCEEDISGNKLYYAMITVDSPDQYETLRIPKHGFALYKTLQTAIEEETDMLLPVKSYLRWRHTDGKVYAELTKES